jgi:hypothetical protein
VVADCDVFDISVFAYTRHKKKRNIKEKNIRNDINKSLRPNVLNNDEKALILE